MGETRQVLQNLTGLNTPIFTVPGIQAPKKPYIAVLEALRTYITPDGPVLHLTLPEELIEMIEGARRA